MKIDYPNDKWDIALNYKRIGRHFAPALGFVPRPAVQLFTRFAGSGGSRDPETRRGSASV